MADEQIRLLQEILEAIKEQNAATKQFRDEVKAVQETALDRQKNALLISRIAFGILFFLLVVFLFWLISTPR